MAYLRGPFGTGYVKRLGATVGQKAGNGRYRISAYQPEVFNPNTRPQAVQRRKFAFLTRLASFIGNDGLVGLERQPYTTLRSAFVKMNMPNVVVVPDSSPVEIDYALSSDKMIVSRGTLMPPTEVRAECAGGILSLRVGTFVDVNHYVPDECIAVALVPTAFEKEGYKALVMRKTYTGAGAVGTGRVAFATFEDYEFTEQYIPTPEVAYDVIVLTYNFAYSRNKGVWSVHRVDTAVGSDAIEVHVRETKRMLYGAHEYSGTIAGYAQNHQSN